MRIKAICYSLKVPSKLMLKVNGHCGRNQLPVPQFVHANNSLSLPQVIFFSSQKREIQEPSNTTPIRKKRGTAQFLQCLPHKDEAPSLDPQYPHREKEEECQSSNWESQLICLLQSQHQGAEAASSVWLAHQQVHQAELRRSRSGERLY